MSDEQWRPVVGYEGIYEVSDHGRVRSLDRFNHIGRRYRGRVLRPSTDRGGYQRVVLSQNGNCKTAKIHSLVLEAFVGPRPDGLHVCHGDSNPANNHLSNLRYATQSENQGRDANLHHNYTSRFNGVAWKKRNSKWEVRARIGGKKKHIGYFHCERDAARGFNAYCKQQGLDLYQNQIPNDPHAIYWRITRNGPCAVST